MRKTRHKIPVRLDAKPTRPHSTKRGARWYRRSKAKTRLHRERGETAEE